MGWRRGWIVDFTVPHSTVLSPARPLLQPQPLPAFRVLVPKGFGVAHQNGQHRVLYVRVCRTLLQFAPPLRSTPPNLRVFLPPSPVSLVFVPDKWAQPVAPFLRRTHTLHSRKHLPASPLLFPVHQPTLRTKKNFCLISRRHGLEKMM